MGRLQKSRVTVSDERDQLRLPANGPVNPRRRGDCRASEMTISIGSFSGPLTRCTLSFRQYAR